MAKLFTALSLLGGITTAFATSASDDLITSLPGADGNSFFFLYFWLLLKLSLISIDVKEKSLQFCQLCFVELKWRSYLYTGLDLPNMYSGYLDISEDKHIFYWFVEAAESPETSPGVWGRKCIALYCF
jgi:hypothetical protein